MSGLSRRAAFRMFAGATMAFALREVIPYAPDPDVLTVEMIRNIADKLKLLDPPIRPDKNGNYVLYYYAEGGAG